MNSELIDSHAHLNFTELADTQSLLARANQSQVETIITIGTNLDDSRLAIKLAAKYPNVYATVGIHPNDDMTIVADNLDWAQFEKLVRQPKVVAIGECGLDYTRLEDKKIQGIIEEKERQKKLFFKTNRDCQ